MSDCPLSMRIFKQPGHPCPPDTFLVYTCFEESVPIRHSVRCSKCGICGATKHIHVYSLSGGPYQTQQDSFMYRREHGVVSFLLDDDNCDCWSTLNAGHAMCHGGFHSTYGMENVHGVGLLNEGGCNSTKFNGPSGENSLFLYYRGMYISKISENNSKMVYYLLTQRFSLYWPISSVI